MVGRTRSTSIPGFDRCAWSEPNGRELASHTVGFGLALIEGCPASEATKHGPSVRVLHVREDARGFFDPKVAGEGVFPAVEALAHARIP